MRTRGAVLACAALALALPFVAPAGAQVPQITWNRELNVGSSAERVLNLQRLTGSAPVLTQVNACYQRTSGFKDFNQQVESCMAMDMAMSFLSTRAAAGPISGKQQLPTTGYADAEKRIRGELKRVGISALSDQTREIQIMAYIVRETLQEALKQPQR